MSISDELMWRYFELVSVRTSAEIAKLREQVATGGNPRDVKFELAGEIVERFHGKPAAEAAHRQFVERFQKGAVPAELRRVTLQSDEAGIKIANVLKEAGLANSTTAAYRLIEQGGVRIDGEKLTDAGRALRPGATHVIQVGKREFAQVTVRSREA
jgi:tyrosyl-tRNA synthetase